MLSCLAPLYLSEIAPREIRGSLLALEQFSIVTGVVVGFWYVPPLLRLVPPPPVSQGCEFCYISVVFRRGIDF